MRKPWPMPEDEDLDLARLDDEDEDDDDEDEEDSKASEKDSEKLIERVLKTRTILVSEPISSSLAKAFYQQLLVMETADSDRAITVIINSPGGEADAGFGMYDMMRFVKPPMRTVVAGLCASAAVMVYLGGDREHRFSLPSSRFLLHQPSSASFGQASDLEIASREILRLRDRYNRIVAEETGKTLEVVTEDADRDFWMSSEEAAEYGLVNKVIISRGEMG